MKRCFVVLAFVLSLPAARAVVLLSDSFSYPNGSLTTNSGFVWSTHSAATGGTGETQVVSGKVQLAFSQSEDVSALLAGQPYPPAGSTNVFYAAFSVRFTTLPSSAGSYFAHFKDTTATGNFRARLWALTSGASTGKFRLGLSSTSGSAVGVAHPTDLSLNVDYRVVMRLGITNSVATLWIDPAAESDSNVSTAEGAQTATVATYALRQASGMGALALDDLVVATTFAEALSNGPPTAPFITRQPVSQTVTQGANVTFTVAAGGATPLSYQWKLESTDLAGATASVLALTNVSFADAGDYSVTITNVAGLTSSAPATLTVTPAPAPPVPGFSIMTYNTKGFGTTNWSTNAPQVQAIGRELMYLQPDIVTLQEIPYTNRYQMVNWVVAYLPGYYLATNSATDGLLASVILSRFPITRSKSWLHSADLDPYGYTANDFTRDLFEAQIAVPGFAQPLHVFTTHLKSGTSSAEDAAKRAAEASAISNFFVTSFLTTNGTHPYLLTGDLNEDLAHPATGSQQPIQRLTNGTGLWLTTPVNPISGGEQTFSVSIQGTLNRRYDYVLPNGLLLSNILSSQVFRTGNLNPVPPFLNSNDDETASDHLPVLMTFSNPYDKPFRLLGITRSNPAATLTWQSVLGQPYRVESSSNLTLWTVLAANLVATNATFIYSKNLPDAWRYFRVYRVP